MNKPHKSRNSEPNNQSPRNIFEIFSCSWALENFSHSRGLRTDISQKTVVGCPCLFSCFVDFREAFNHIPRQKLFDKLRKKKIFKGASYKYRFLCTRTIIRRSNWQEINPILSLLLRVKAGLHRYHLGSLNCYLRDLPNLLNSTASSADITLGEKSINGLLYADDLVIFSRSAKGLQNMFLISKMESFCDFADLDVNIDKTKVMIFNNCGNPLTTIRLD